MKGLKASVHLARRVAPNRIAKIRSPIFTMKPRPLATRRVARSRSASAHRSSGEFLLPVRFGATRRAQWTRGSGIALTLLAIYIVKFCEDEK